MAVRIHDTSGNVDKAYLATHVNQCQGDTDREVFRLVEETGEVITMGKVIGEPAGNAQPPSSQFLAHQRVGVTQQNDFSVELAYIDEEPPLKGEGEIVITRIPPSQRRHGRTAELLDLVNHLHRTAELASSLESRYAAMEPSLDEDLDDEPPVWTAAQDMIDKLQPLLQLDETAGELEEAEQSITDADADDYRQQYGERI